jgi:hypothetical protein
MTKTSLLAINHGGKKMAVKSLDCHRKMKMQYQFYRLNCKTVILVEQLQKRNGKLISMNAPIA